MRLMSAAAQALQQADDCAGWMDQHDRIDAADVDTQLQARAADDDAQFSLFEPSFHQAPAAGSQGRVMDCRLLLPLRMRATESPDEPFRQAARVRENQQRAVVVDL